MRLPGTTLSNYMDSLDHTTLARVGQRTRAAKEQADILADFTDKKSQLTEAGNNAIFDIQQDAGNYAQGQQQQASWFSTGADLIGMGVGVAGKMGAFGGGGGYSGTGSTGGPGDTVRVGDTGKYGSFQDPMIDFNRNGYTYDPSNGMFYTG